MTLSEGLHRAVGIMNARYRQVLTFAFVLGLVLALTPQPLAWAHLQFANSVDTSTTPGEIRYLNGVIPSHNDARVWAIVRWRDVGSIVIQPDNSSTVADLEFQSDGSDPGLCGRYIPYATIADDIKFYTPSWNNLSDSQQDDVPHMS